MNLFIILVMVTSCTSFTIDTFVATVTAVKEHLFSGCVHVLHNPDIGLQYSKVLNVAMKKLWKNQLSIAFTSTSKLLESINSLRCQSNIPLLILPHYLQDTRALLSKVSSKTHMADFVWLLFLEETNSLEAYFGGINIPFDCKFLVAQLENDQTVTLTEVYRVSFFHPLQTYPFGNWTSQGGLAWPAVMYYRRRNDLQGLVLRKGSAMPIPREHKFEMRQEMRKPDIFGRVWRLLEKDMNFTTEHRFPRDGPMGGPRSRRDSWSSVFGMLQRRQIDVADGLHTMTSARVGAVEFTAPVLEIRTHLIIEKPRVYTLRWNIFLLPFSRQLWSAMGITVLLLMAFLALIHQLETRCGILHDDRLGLTDIMFYIISVFCQQAQGVPPKSNSLRLMFLASYLTAVVLLACYSAAFITHLTLRDPVLPFTNFEEFLKDGSYKLGMVPNSSTFEYFKESKVKLLRDIYKKHIAPHQSTFDDSDFMGMQRLCGIEKYAYMTSLFNLGKNGFFPKCEITIISDAYFPGTLAIAIAKKSPYRGLFNHKLQTLKINGMYKEEFKHGSHQLLRPPDEKKLSVDLDDAAPILFILIFGISASLIICVIEIFVSRQ